MIGVHRGDVICKSTSRFWDLQAEEILRHGVGSRDWATAHCHLLGGVSKELCRSVTERGGVLRKSFGGQSAPYENTGTLVQSPEPTLNKTEQSWSLWCVAAIPVESDGYRKMREACWPASLPSLLGTSQASERSCPDFFFKRWTTPEGQYLKLSSDPPHTCASAHVSIHTQREKKMKQEPESRPSEAGLPAHPSQSLENHMQGFDSRGPEGQFLNGQLTVWRPFPSPPSMYRPLHSLPSGVPRPSLDPSSVSCV